MRTLALLAALALSLGASGAVAPGAAAGGESQAVASAATKNCKKAGKKKPKHCKGGKRPGTQKPWAGGPYRPGQVCSLAPEMQKKYKRYGLFCLDLGLGIWTLEPL